MHFFKIISKDGVYKRNTLLLATNISDWTDTDSGLFHVRLAVVVSRSSIAIVGPIPVPPGSQCMVSLV